MKWFGPASLASILPDFLISRWRVARERAAWQIAENRCGLPHLRGNS
jgi:hypothetical protein